MGHAPKKCNTFSKESRENLRHKTQTLFGTNSEKGTIVTGARRPSQWCPFQNLYQTDWRDHNHRSWGLLSIFRTLFGNLPPADWASLSSKVATGSASCAQHFSDLKTTQRFTRKGTTRFRPHRRTKGPVPVLSVLPPPCAFKLRR